MWLDLPTEVTAWVSRARIGVRAVRPGLGGRRVISAAVGSFSDLAKALRACVMNRPRVRVNAWIGSGACRFFSFEVDASVRDAEERLALATAIGERRHGLVRQQWRISVDRRPTRSIGLGCGVEEDLLKEIRSAAAAVNGNVTLIAPWISAVTHHPAVAAVQRKQIIVSEPGAITVVHESDAAARLVLSLSCDEGEDRSAVKKQLLESSGLSASALGIQLTLSESRLAAGASARLLDLVEIEK